VTRAFVDRNLIEWEAFASTPRGGLPAPGRIVFRCLSDRDVRSRFLPVDGTRATAEARIQELSEQELRDFVEEAGEIP